MNITAVTCKFKTHNNTQKTRTLIVVLLTVALISSLLTVGVLFMTNLAPSPDGDAIHVKNEKELVDAINKAKKSTTIKLDNDITLTKPLTIPNKKNITLTSNIPKEFFKLIGAGNYQTAITVSRGGVVYLAGITVTQSETKGIGVNVTDGGKLYMTNGEISGNHGWDPVDVWWSGYSYGGGVVVCSGGFFEMTGGEISNNYAKTDYGGVYNMGTFNQSGGTITGNKTNGKHPNQ